MNQKNFAGILRTSLTVAAFGVLACVIRYHFSALTQSWLQMTSKGQTTPTRSVLSGKASESVFVTKQSSRSSAPASRSDDGRSAIPSAWERLDHPVILDTARHPQPDGGLRRLSLVRTSGKYPQVVFEGTVPADDLSVPNDALLNPVAYVADHLIVSAKAGSDPSDFRRSIASAGMRASETHEFQALCVFPPPCANKRIIPIRFWGLPCSISDVKNMP